MKHLLHRVTELLYLARRADPLTHGSPQPNVFWRTAQHEPCLPFEKTAFGT